MYSYNDFKKISGKNISLHRLSKEDINTLGEALISPDTWFSKMRGNSSPEKFAKTMMGFLEKQNRGEALVVVVRLNSTEEMVAMSIYHSASPEFSRVEIGYTWIADKWQRTFVNTEMKFLMLGYAFETMKVARVEFLVDPRNEKSNRAMLRIGAKFEGLLRKYRTVTEFDAGDRNFYSVIDDDWARLKMTIFENHKLFS